MNQELMATVVAIVGASIPLGAVMFALIRWIDGRNRKDMAVLREDMKALEGRLEARINGAIDGLREDMRATEGRLREELKALEGRLEARIDELKATDRRLEDGIGEVNDRLSKVEGVIEGAFLMSVYENVVYPLRIDGERDKQVLDSVCHRALQGAALWDEVKDRLHESALGLSGGQQQRLCIARAVAAEPEVLLMDEPASALDPIATSKIEDLIHELKGRYTILIVTHNMQQASRVSDITAFMYLGRLIEFAPTEEVFVKPQLQETEDYISGRFG